MSQQSSHQDYQRSVQSRLLRWMNLNVAHNLNNLLKCLISANRRFLETEHPPLSVPKQGPWASSTTSQRRQKQTPSRPPKKRKKPNKIQSLTKSRHKSQLQPNPPTPSHLNLREKSESWSVKVMITSTANFNVAAWLSLKEIKIWIDILAKTSRTYLISQFKNSARKSSNVDSRLMKANCPSQWLQESRHT